MKLLERVRPEIRALRGYSSARMEAHAAAIMLNANEAPWPPPMDADRSWNRYPEPQPEQLRARMAANYRIAPDQILLGRGSDEAIDLLIRAFCAAGRDAVLIAPPTFAMYAVAARIQDAQVLEAPLRADFALDVESMLALATEAVKLVFVCSPNNPTATLVPLDDIERLAGALRERALVVVDEAYLEFAADAPSATTLLERYDNVAVLRTLSKAYALAAARIGCLIAHADIVALLRRIQAPYPLPAPCVDAALRALSPAALAATGARVARLRTQRAGLSAALARLPGVRAVLPSSANFLCVRFRDAACVQRSLRERGIVVRDVGGYPGLAGCLRISVGSVAENAALLETLEAREAAA